MNAEYLIAAAAREGASDIHVVAGLTPRIRKHGRMVPLFDEPMTGAGCDALAMELSDGRLETLFSVGELDAAKTIAGRRVRINLFRQQGQTSMALRILADRIPPLESLGLPPKVAELTDLNNGIVLVTGETGSGKSTTLAAMIQRINESRAEHILTLEDPIEYVYTPALSIINQREIGRDTASFAAGLRAALREDPDIILVGEMRDLDTIETALTAAETGHLVLGTLHTGSAADSIDRMVDVFPDGRQRQIRMQLSMTLRAVLSQQLLPTRDGEGRVAVCELMVVNAAIRNLIREGKTPQIASAVSTSAAEGGITMDNAIIRLFRAGKISAAVARAAARDADYMKKNVF